MVDSKNVDVTIEKLAALCKRRGFIFPSSELYGGLANTYDYGPYGTELKDNIRNLWWSRFVRTRPDVFGVDASVIINPKVWQASGHVANFGDVMVEDAVNHKRYRADHIIEDFFAKRGQDIKVDGKPAEELQKIIETESIISPDGNPLTTARKFNLLFQTEIGIIEGEGSTAYLRGEIAQGLFMNFKNILDSMHPKLPFGIAQAGKAFRNEITKGQFTFRTLEFDLMELEYFFDPTKQPWQELFDQWKGAVQDFALLIGLRPGKLRWRPHEAFELSHYSQRTEDLEYEFPWGFKEMFGIAYRTDFDLKNHEQHSGQDLKYTYPDGTKVTPHVLEPTFGLSRLLTIVLLDAYREDTVNGETRVFLQLHPLIAPVKCAIFPLTKDERITAIATDLQQRLSAAIPGMVVYDETGSIGKRYRKQDEIGTPFCVTVDFDSLEDQHATVRHRDTLEQVRLPLAQLPAYLQDHLHLST